MHTLSVPGQGPGLWILMDPHWTPAPGLSGSRFESSLSFLDFYFFLWGLILRVFALGLSVKEEGAPEVHPGAAEDWRARSFLFASFPSPEMASGCMTFLPGLIWAMEQSK